MVEPRDRCKLGLQEDILASPVLYMEKIVTHIHLPVITHSGDKRYRPRGYAPGHELIHGSIVQVLSRLNLSKRALRSKTFVFGLEFLS